MTPLKKAYEYNPVFEGITRPEFILGVEAPLWTEYVPDRATVDRQVFPRLTAVAETAWSGPGADGYTGFRTRLREFNGYLRSLGANPADLSRVDPGRLAGRWQLARFWWHALDGKMFRTFWKLVTRKL